MVSRARSLVFILTALAAAGPLTAQAPTAGAAEGGWRGDIARRGRALATARASARAAASAAARAARPTKAQTAAGARRVPVAAATLVGVNETEPNNTPATANPIALGDTAIGEVNPFGDEDFWSFTAAAGTLISVDVDAWEFGSPLDPTLELIASDGVTSLAFNDDWDGLDSRISYQIPTTGTYYLALRGYAGSGGPGYFYSINTRTFTCPTIAAEAEPNDSPGTARAVTLGGTGDGVICPTADSDYWSFTAPAGTILDLDVDAWDLGSPLDANLTLLAGDGVTVLAFNDNRGGPDPRIEFTVPSTGTYYAVVRTYWEGGDLHTYTLRFNTIAPGPGDPVTTIASGMAFPFGLATGAQGDLFVGDLDASQIRRVTPQGSSAAFASVPAPFGMAWDALGNLLVAAGDGEVWRVTPQGQASPFITDPNSPFWVAVGPDGTIWLTDLGDASIRRYSAGGQRIGLIDASGVGSFGPGPLAIGPGGVPHFSNGNEIWRVTGSTVERVFTADFIIYGFAFDAAGNIYVPNPDLGRIILYSPTGTVLANPFAVGPIAPFAVAFGRTAGGLMNARVFATDGDATSLIEVNPSGVLGPGLPMGFTPTFTVGAAAEAVLGGADLTQAEKDFLDSVGNRNGRYDVGDFRAWLIVTGVVTRLNGGAP